MPSIRNAAPGAHPLAQRDPRARRWSRSSAPRPRRRRPTPEPLARRPARARPLLGGEEPQRGVALGDLAGPQVAVGPEAERRRSSVRAAADADAERRRGRGRSPPAKPAAASRSCQRTPRAADLLGREPGVERDLGGDRGERLGRGLDPGLVAERGGELGQHLPDRAHLARARDRGAQALQAAVGVGDRALLLGVGLGREDDVGGLGRGVVEAGDRDHGPRLAQRLGPAGAVGQLADRVGAEAGRAVELAVEQALLDLLEAAAGSARRRSPGPAPGRQPTSRSAAGVGAVGDADQRRRRRPRRRAPRRSRAARASAASPSRPRPSRSPQTITVLPGRSSPADAARRSAAPQLASAVRVAVARARRPARRGTRRPRPARSGRSPRRRRRARSGGRRRRRGAGPPWRTALRRRRSRIGIELQRVGAEDQDRLGVVDVGDRRRRAPGPRGRAAVAASSSSVEVTCGEPSASRTIRWTR